MSRVIHLDTDIIVEEGQTPRMLAFSVTERPTNGPVVDLSATQRDLTAIITDVVEDHEYLALDDEGDRETLIAALVEALTP